MALPDSPSDIAFAPNGGRHGPFADGSGNYYFAARDGTNVYQLNILKNTNPGTASWTEAATDTVLDTSTTIYSIDAIQDSTNLYILVGTGDGTNVDYQFYIFSMSSDSFTTTDESAFTIGTNPPSTSDIFGSLARRSDGSIVAVIQDAIEKVHGADYSRVSYLKRSTGGTWDASTTAVDDGGEINYRNPRCILGASNKVHIAYQHGTNDLDHKSLNSSDTLSSAEAVNDNSYTGQPEPRIAYLNDGTDDLVAIIWDASNATENTTRASIITNDGTPGAESTISSGNVQGDLLSTRLTAVNNSDTTSRFYAVWIDATDDDLEMAEYIPGTGWQTEVAIEESITATEVAGCNVYTNDSSDTVLAYLYTESTNGESYNEYVLASSGITINATADVLASAGQAATITPGAVSISATVGALAAAGQTATISNVANIPTTTATLASAGQTANITPGAVTISGVADVLASSGQTATITPGAVSISGIAAILASAGQTSTINNVAVINTIAGILASATSASSITPGQVSIQTIAGILASAGQAASISVGASSIPTTAAILVSAGQSAAITPGGVSIQTVADVLASAGLSGIVSVGNIIQAALATLSASGQSASIIPGAVSIPATTTALFANGEAASLLAGGVTIQTIAPSLLSAGYAATLDTPVSIQTNTIVLASNGESTSILAGVVLIQAQVVVLSSTGYAATITAIAALLQVDSDNIYHLPARNWIEQVASREWLQNTVSRNWIEDVEGRKWIETIPAHNWIHEADD